MSGTSLDGLDICYTAFHRNEDNAWRFNILKAETLPYSTKWKQLLEQAFLMPAPQLMALHSEYGFYLAEAVQKFIQRHHIGQVDVIASHGHTVFHQPEKKYTLQIGDGRAIHIINSIPTAYDFRSQDVLMGGNGAPLVPIGDELLFSEYDACLNIGGFSNISLKQHDKRIAFDICPVNIVLNFFAQILNKNYDDNGNLARQGEINLEILNQLNELKFYSAKGAKSLGREWIETEILPKLKPLSPKDALATATEHAAIKIAQSLGEHQIDNVLITGGGAYNGFLIEKIKEKTSSSIIIPSREVIDFKEALIFALMGVLRLQNENNVLASATGSSQDHCSGILVGDRG